MRVSGRVVLRFWAMWSVKGSGDVLKCFAAGWGGRWKAKRQLGNVSVLYEEVEKNTSKNCSKKSW